MNIIRKSLTNMLRKKLKLDPLANISTSSQNENTVKNTYDVDSYKAVPSSSLEYDVSLADQFLKIELELNESLKKLNFKQPVAYVYSPLDYAFKPHLLFTNKYCKTSKKILFVGMNPGPWGMCQTGIPFGEVNIVRDWFQIREDVSKPDKECPSREVIGLDCSRSEVSGQRIWGLFKTICGTPENFFKSAYMYNYCPIALLKNNGGNITPAEIKGDAQKGLEELCDKALYNIIQLLQSEVIVGVGKFAEKRAQEVLKKDNPLNTKVLYLLHPSPRVCNNQNWLITAEKRLNDLNLITYFKN